MLFSFHISNDVSRKHRWIRLGKELCRTALSASQARRSLAIPEEVGEQLSGLHLPE